MRWTVVLALTLVCGFALCASGNYTPGALTAIDIEPCAGQIGDAGGMANQALGDQGYSVLQLHQDTYGTSRPLIVNLDVYVQQLQGGYGVFYVTSHGGLGITTEMYEHTQPGYTAANSAYWDYVDHHGYSTNDIRLTEDPGQNIYGISLRSGRHATEFLGAGGIEAVNACSTFCWAGTGWPGSHVVLSFDQNIDAGVGYAQFSAMFARLDGWNGKAKRVLTNALEASPLIRTTGSTDIVLAPSILNVSPTPGTVISSLTPGFVEFDAFMDTGVNGGSVVQVTEKAITTDEVWTSSNRLDFKIDPYGQSASVFRVTTDAKSQFGGAIIDGNTDPPNEDGRGPNRDSYEVGFTANGYDTNWACSFEGAGAFADVDGTHVWWVTDPELGSQSFTVYGGRGRATALTTVAAEGGPNRSHYYEVILSALAETVFEIVETDDDPSTEFTSRPFARSEPPENLELLRSMNGSEDTWVPLSWDPDEGGGRTEVPPVSVVFYSSRSDFLSGCQPVINYLEAHGVTTTTVLGSSSPYAAKTAAEAAYESAIQEELPYLPLFVVVGEANEGDHPERNIVGTIYIPDEDDQCYWNSCASDPSIVEFDGDKLPDLPWSRIPVSTTTELGYAVTTALEVYNNQHVMSPRILLLDGDFSGLCNPLTEPRATVLWIAQQYQAEGISAVVLHDTDVPDCGDYATRLARAQSYINSSAGITELGGLGFTTHRSLLPGYHIQKLFTPVFQMSHVPKLQRIVGEFPGCGMGDTDRNNPSYYPSIPKMFVASNPANSTTAAGWISHARGGDETLHLAFAREYFRARLDGESWCVQEAQFRAIRSLGLDPAARDYLLLAAAYGFPVAVPGLFNPSLVQEELNLPKSVSLTVGPNPVRNGTTITYALPGYGRVDIRLYDVQGRSLCLLVEHQVTGPGRHQLAWDGRDKDRRNLAAGVYYLRLQINGRDRVTSKVVILQ